MVVDAVQLLVGTGVGAVEQSEHATSVIPGFAHRQLRAYLTTETDLGKAEVSSDHVRRGSGRRMICVGRVAA
jgi:hypothetical protein